MREWEEEELESIDLGDTRLNTRSQQILKKFLMHWAVVLRRVLADGER